MRRMRWKAYFFLNDPKNEITEKPKTFNFNTRKCAPICKEMLKFEEDMTNIVRNLKFKNHLDNFQKKIIEDKKKKIMNSNKAFILADKTTNIYTMESTTYNKLITNKSQLYKGTTANTKNMINHEAKDIVVKLKIDERINCIAEQQAFITAKDHKIHIPPNQPHEKRDRKKSAKLY